MTHEWEAEELPELLTAKEVSELLGVHPKTIHVWVSYKRLPCFHLGNRLRFAYNDVLRWAAARKESVR